MSYILDALKKSQEERELVRMLRTTGAAPGFSFAGRRRLWPAIIAFLALVIGGFLIMRYLGPSTPVTPNALSDPSMPAMPAPAGATAQTAVAASAPAAREAASKPPVEDLAAQTRVARLTPVAAQPQPVMSPKPPSPQGVAVNEAEEQGAVLFLRQMPEDFRRRLPALAVNIHLYSANPIENLVYINDRQYRRGEEVTPGVRLEEIVPEGVVLSYEGKRFKVPRPN